MHIHNANPVIITKSACQQAFLSNFAIKKWEKATIVEETSTDTTQGAEDKTKAEPLLTLPFREKRV